VLLVHGLWLRPIAMTLIRRRLRSCGYRVESYSYPTMRLGLEENAERLTRYCERLTGKLHLFGHSMGGIVAVKAAALVPRGCLGRVVVAGTPFRDCFAGRALQRLPGGRGILGRSMEQWLATDSRPAFDACELGVIAGTRGVGLGRLIAPGLRPPHDGVVSVDETRIDGMTDHVVLKVAHTEMLVSRPVVHQVCTFLEHGKFDRSQPGVGSVN
jgi:pimeloyl-ACP methyl ester carboxylesterase